MRNDIQTFLQQKMTLKFLHFSIFLFIIFFACVPAKRLPQKKEPDFLSKAPQNWTYAECEAVLKKYTTYNKKGYNQKYSQYALSHEDVFIEVKPLNKHVISALMRKDAINKRLSVPEYHERLKDYLEAFTNWTLNDKGKIFARTTELLDEYSFLVLFENISIPHRTIEEDGAYDGFFLENAKKEFSRVIEISGRDADEYFVLVSDLKVTITFSSKTDENQKLNFNEKTYKDFRLIFNGLQTKPILVEW